MMPSKYAINDPSCIYAIPAQDFPLYRWCFYLCIVCIPFAGFSLYNAAGRGWLRLDWLAGVALIAAFVTWLTITRSPRMRSTVHVLTVAFVFSALLGFFKLSPASSAQYIDFCTKAAQLLLAVLFFFAVSNLPMRDRDFSRCLKLWISTAMVTALYGIYQVVGHIYSWPFTDIALSNPSITYGGGEARIFDKYIQPASIFREPSYFGAFLLGPILVLAVFLLSKKEDLLYEKRPWGAWIRLLVLVLALLLTTSQAAYITLFVAAAFLLFLGGSRFPRKGAMVATLLLFAVLGGTLLTVIGIDLPSIIGKRFYYLILNIADPSSLEITSYRVRSDCILAALRIWVENPVIGVGLNNMRYHTSVCEFTQGWPQLLVDQGLTGLLLLGGIFWILYSRLIRMSKSPLISPFRTGLCLAIAIVLISEIVDGVFTYNWVDMNRWFMLGMANLVLLRTGEDLPSLKKGEFP